MWLVVWDTYGACNISHYLDPDDTGIRGNVKADELASIGDSLLEQSFLFWICIESLSMLCSREERKN